METRSAAVEKKKTGRSPPGDQPSQGPPRVAQKWDRKRNRARHVAMGRAAAGPRTHPPPVTAPSPPTRRRTPPVDRLQPTSLRGRSCQVAPPRARRPLRCGRCPCRSRRRRRQPPWTRTVRRRCRCPRRSPAAAAAAAPAECRHGSGQQGAARRCYCHRYSHRRRHYHRHSQRHPRYVP